MRKGHSSTTFVASAPFTVFYFLCNALATFACLLSQPVDAHPPSLTVPSFPLQTDSQLCHLDLSDELFGGVNEACGRNLDRSRCCPVLAAWLYAAHARSAIQIGNASFSSRPTSSDLPMLPDEDSQKCVDSLQNSLLSRNIRLPQPNATCDALLCFCGIRLHSITSRICPAAFINITAAPTAAVKNLERSCRNSTYAGCSECLTALRKVEGGGGHNGTASTERASQIYNRECQYMGLTWLLARNKTTYIPTVSAVLRAVMYSPHPHVAKCSPDQENMPLAVDSLSYDDEVESSSASVANQAQRCFSLLLHILAIVVFHSCFTFV